MSTTALVHSAAWSFAFSWTIGRSSRLRLCPRDAPRLITVDVKGAKALILLTEFGEHGGVRDFADWGDARIIR